LCPLVTRGVVLPDRAGGRAVQTDRISAEQIQLAIRHYAVTFLVRLRNRCQPYPASVRGGLATAATAATTRSTSTAALTAAAAAPLGTAVRNKTNRTAQH